VPGRRTTDPPAEGRSSGIPALGVPLGRRLRSVLRRAGQGTARGIGPLLQRDYWAVIEGCRMRPSEVMQLVERRFAELAPEDVGIFSRPGGGGPLVVGEVLEVRIRLAGMARVRVAHVCATSFTLATLPGHPEAGRITFGAYRNGRGDVVFHVRSRARSSGRLEYVGFLAAGDALQTAMWTDLIDRVAASCGRGVLAWIHAETTECDDEDDARAAGPTFLAQAD
jgi:hypothetical protein